MRANSWHINYSTSICPFESGNCGKEGKKWQNMEYLENEKSFFDEKKKHWRACLKDYHLVKKKKKWYKIADASFNKVFTWRATIP